MNPTGPSNQERLPAPRAVKVVDHRPSGFFCLRTPLLSFDGLRAMLGPSNAARAVRMGVPDAQLERVLALDWRRHRERLRAALANPIIREAIFLASPDLEERLERWLAHWDGDPRPRIERSLARYFIRMAARPAPFGLFAGVSIGFLGAHTTIRL